MEPFGAFVAVHLVIDKRLMHRDLRHARLKVTTLFGPELASPRVYDNPSAFVAGILIATVWGAQKQSDRDGEDS